MLFGLANASGHAPHDESLFASLRYDRGLGAVVPHFANLRTTSGGGGGIHVSSIGSGSGDSSGSALSPTMPPGPGASYGLRPVGRNTSFLRRGGLSHLFQPTGQGARAIPGRGAGDESVTEPMPSTPVFPTGGLFDGLSGLESFWSGIGRRVQRAVTVPRSRPNIIKAGLAPLTGGLSLLAPSRWFVTPHRTRSAPPVEIPEDSGGGPGLHPVGMSGLGLNVGGFLKRTIAIPKSPANIARIALAPFTAGVSLVLPTRVLTPPAAVDSFFRSGIDTVIRPAIRYTGAVTQSVLFPVLTGGQQRSMFGLSPSESAVFMKGQQVFRAIDAVVLTFGLAKFVLAAQEATAAPGLNPSVGLAPTPDKLSLLPSTTGFVPGGSATPLSLPAGYATPAQLGAVAAQSAPAAASTSLDLALPSAANFTPAGGAPMSLPPGYATPASIAGSAPAGPAAPGAGGGSGILGTIGKGAADAGKFVGAAAVTTAAQIAVQAALAKGQGGGQAGQGGGQVVTVPDAGAGQAAQPVYPVSSDPGVGPDLSAIGGGIGVPQLVIGGLVVTAIVGAVVVRRKKQPKRRMA